MHTADPAGGIDGKVVVLVDDVLYSGRTVRAALDALSDLGRPARGPARRARRPRPPRAADPRRPRRQEPADRPAAEQVQVRLAEHDGIDDVVRDRRRDEAAMTSATCCRCADLDPRRRPDASSTPRPRCTTCSTARSRSCPTLRGRTVVNLFFEDSTRTRSSLRDRRQVDVAPTSSTSPARARRPARASPCATPCAPSTRWAVDALVIRHMRQRRRATRSRSGSTRSVINAGDGTHEHPTQALLDAYTMRAAARRPRGPARRHRRRPHPLAGSSAPT